MRAVKTRQNNGAIVSEHQVSKDTTSFSFVVCSLLSGPTVTAIFFRMFRLSHGNFRLISGSLLRSEFLNHDGRPSAELGYSVDRRKLGLAVERIVPQPAAK